MVAVDVVGQVFLLGVYAVEGCHLGGYPLCGPFHCT